MAEKLQQLLQKQWGATATVFFLCPSALPTTQLAEDAVSLCLSCPTVKCHVSAWTADKRELQLSYQTLQWNEVQAHVHFCWHSYEKNQKSRHSMLSQQQPHLLPRYPAAACLLIISFKDYEPKLELLSYSPRQVSMRKLLQLQLLPPSRNQNIVQKLFFISKGERKCNYIE